ncbi:hypothetical protein D9758_014791 [Tetrapyrgos nigripes]|uniref:G-patch domain-containing protein n=1 Tax=Tetrapyrgos nigripes TaxID=182062 RepID=A0A8H5FGF6_9AGAR|nr:hypothetical protein D9758_014791 [Tetrapyrgos nigripes]
MFGCDRVGKKKLFRAIQDGDFGDIDGFMDVGKPATIRKQERELLKLQAAADPLALKKGGKKGRKAMLATAKLDPTITVVLNCVINMTTLIQQIRRFLDDLDQPSSMSLPPCNKHDLVNAFNLKSVSKGHGDARYTTLTKTTRSGIQVNEKKVARIVRRGGGVDFVGSAGDGWERGGKKGGARIPKHREEEEIGKAAPKINEGNVGFRMLTSMGWSEGDCIGLSSGLRDPLTVVIKHIKLGLPL